jgi:glycosyltransferase involved in cell wall biosynthesis
MRNPAVSIIMPCYRAAATLRTAVISVQSQSFGDFELLIIDDGSPDETFSVANELAAADARIHVMHQRNAGPAAARNLGIGSARAPILAFLDADDRWAPELLARHLERLGADPGCGVSFARIRFFDPTLSRAGRVSAPVRDLTLSAVLGENPVCTTSNIVARRAVFGEAGDFNTGITHGEDQEWLARVLATTRWQVRGLPNILVDYRTSPGGLSADLDAMQRGWTAVMNCVRGYAPREVRRVESEAAAIFYRYLARRALRIGRPMLSLRPMLKAWGGSPVTLLTHQPLRTAMTMLGVLAALIPGNPARAILSR